MIDIILAIVEAYFIIGTVICLILFVAFGVYPHTLQRFIGAAVAGYGWLYWIFVIFNEGGERKQQREMTKDFDKGKK